MEIYQEMFGDPWNRAAAIGPLFPDGLSQPELELPFAPGRTLEPDRRSAPVLEDWQPAGRSIWLRLPAKSSARCLCGLGAGFCSGLVVRSERNVVAIDLDGDGHEQTGWVIIYMHIADQERIPAGSSGSRQTTQLGHPSCEGGTSTGTHVHIARKYNGEWIAADGPLPFVLSGWQAFAGQKVYLGGMTKGNQQVVASPVGPSYFDHHPLDLINALQDFPGEGAGFFQILRDHVLERIAHLVPVRAAFSSFGWHRAERQGDQAAFRGA